MIVYIFPIDARVYMPNLLQQGPGQTHSGAQTDRVGTQRGSAHTYLHVHELCRRRKCSRCIERNSQRMRGRYHDSGRERSSRDYILLGILLDSSHGPLLYISHGPLLWIMHTIRAHHASPFSRASPVQVDPDPC